MISLPQTGGSDAGIYQFINQSALLGRVMSNWQWYVQRISARSGIGLAILLLFRSAVDGGFYVFGCSILCLRF